MTYENEESKTERYVVAGVKMASAAVLGMITTTDKPEAAAVAIGLYAAGEIFSYAMNRDQENKIKSLKAKIGDLENLIKISQRTKNNFHIYNHTIQ